MALIRDQVLRAQLAGAEKTASARFASAKGAPPRSPAAGVAVGIGPHGGGKKGYRLAVRVLEGGSTLSDIVLRALSPLKGEELDLVRGVTYKPRYTLRAGGSCGHFRITAGTLGGFVENEDNYYMLSNNHVFADSDGRREGDDIWQPGPLDVTKTKPKVIGHLFKKLPLDTSDSGTIDAALATFSDSVKQFDPWNYAGIGQMDPRVLTDRFEVGNVVKRGRTTKVTRGQVSAFELDGVQINYGTEYAPRVVTFDNQMEFVHAKPSKPFSQPGDSGAFILDAATLRPAALLFGGGVDEHGIDRTLGHFLPTVLDALGVRLIPRSRLGRKARASREKLAITLK